MKQHKGVSKTPCWMKEARHKRKHALWCWQDWSGGIDIKIMVAMGRRIGWQEKVLQAGRNVLTWLGYLHSNAFVKIHILGLERWLSCWQHSLYDHGNQTLDQQPCYTSGIWQTWVAPFLSGSDTCLSLVHTHPALIHTCRCTLSHRHE